MMQIMFTVYGEPVAREDQDLPSEETTSKLTPLSKQKATKMKCASLLQKQKAQEAP